MVVFGLEVSIRRFTTRFLTLMTFGALLVSFGEPSHAASVPQAYEGTVSPVFNNPTGDQISAGDPVTGTLTYNPSPTETNGSMTAWRFISENFTLQSNNVEFSYSEQDPAFWIFDLMGDISGTVGSSDFIGSVWIMLDGDFSDFSTSAPLTFGDLVERLAGDQLTFFVGEETSGGSSFEIEIRAENIAVIPLPASFVLLLSAFVGLTLRAWASLISRRYNDATLRVKTLKCQKYHISL